MTSIREIIKWLLDGVFCTAQTPKSSTIGELLENVSFWESPNDWLSWKILAPKAGKYRAAECCGSVFSGSAMVVEVGDKKFSAVAPHTGDWAKFAEVDLGAVDVKAGAALVKARPCDAPPFTAPAAFRLSGL